MRNYILPILAGIFVLVAVPLTVYLAANPGIIADLRRRASTPTGTAEVRLDPTSATMASIGDTTTVSVLIDPKGLPIGAAQVRLVYSFTGATPEIGVVGRPTGADANLTYITRAATVDDTAKTVTIDVAAYADPSGLPAGYSPGAEFTFATFQLQANAVGSMTINFDAANSKLNRKGGAGEDVLLTPTSTGTYTVGGAAATPTPTPTPAPVTCTQAAFSDTFSGASINQTNWAAWPYPAGALATTVQANGVLTETVPAGQTSYTAAVLDTRSIITGDFETTVDITANQPTTGNWGHPEIRFHSSDWIDGFAIGISWQPDGRYQLYVWNNLRNGGVNERLDNATFYATNGGPVTVRMKRAGQTVTFYLKDSSGNFVQMATKTGGIYTGDGAIALQTNNDGTFPAITGIFDNFSLSCPTSVTATPTPTPTPSARGYHYECRSNVCVRITGNGNDTGGCSVEGAGCLYQHKTCSNYLCVTAYCSPDSSPCADNCSSNANCSTASTTTPTPTTTATTATTQPTLPQTGAVENTLIMAFFGGLLLFAARVLLVL